uniref:LRR binding FLII interacting protein 1 n=1 Tax=Cyclopterus lumpus TaxID=8103 RepID=A0A8C3AHN9_CYCLU
MGTQGTGRKRSTKKERSTAEDDALNLIAREAEARLAAKRAARAEAREIRQPWGHKFEEFYPRITYVLPKSKQLNIRGGGGGGHIIKIPTIISPLRIEIQHLELFLLYYVRAEIRSGVPKMFFLLSANTVLLSSLPRVVTCSDVVALCCSAHCCCTLHQEIHELKDQIQDVESKYTQNLKEVKDAFVEVEEKYRKAMVSNAQLDNDKNNLMYQVDTLKDSLMELEELLFESHRGYEEKVKDHEREKHAHTVLQFQFSEMKETLKQSEELLNDIRQLRIKQEGFVREISDLQETVEWKDKKIGALERQKEYTDAIRIERDELREEAVKLKDILKKHGIVLGPDLNINGEIGEAEVDGSPTSDVECFLKRVLYLAEIRLRKLVDEREKMIEQVKKLKSQLEQKTLRNGTENSSSPDGDILENGTDPNLIELQRDSSRQMSDFKFKLVKAEQEVTASEQNVTRLEGQVTRYKSAAENSEKVEDELKAEKRKLQRELRSALDKVDELESNNSHLSKRLEKMKTSRGMAQTP